MHYGLYLELVQLIYEIQRPSPALGYVQCTNVHPWLEKHLLEMQCSFDIGSLELAGGGGGPWARGTCWPLPYSQFTVTLTCLTSAEETSLAALHSYLPDCSLVMPRISRYSSSPSNSLPVKQRFAWFFFKFKICRRSPLFFFLEAINPHGFSIIWQCSLSEVRFYRSRLQDKKSFEND